MYSLNQNFSFSITRGILIMLKKLLAGASAIALGMVVAADAMAECDGIYLGIRGGVAQPDIGDRNTTGDRLDIDDNLFMLSGAIGYRYTYFRAEFEYIWRDKARDSETIVTPIAGRPDPIVSTSIGEFDYDSYMFNLYYDFSPYTWFTPYFQAGIGVTNMEYKFHYVGEGSHSLKENNFTWVLGGGISAKMTNRLNIDVGYRYYDMGKIGDGKVHNQEIYGGLRYVF